MLERPEDWPDLTSAMEMLPERISKRTGASGLDEERIFRNGTPRNPHSARPSGFFSVTNSTPETRSELITGTCEKIDGRLKPISATSAVSVGERSTLGWDISAS